MLTKHYNGHDKQDKKDDKRQLDIVSLILYQKMQKSTGCFIRIWFSVKIRVARN